MKLKHLAMSGAILGTTLGLVGGTASAAPATSKMECTPTSSVAPVLCARVYGPSNTTYVDEVWFQVEAAPKHPWFGTVWFQMRPYSTGHNNTTPIAKRSKGGHANFEQCIIFSGYIQVESMIASDGRWKVGLWTAPGSPELKSVLEGTIHG